MISIVEDEDMGKKVAPKKNLSIYIHIPFCVKKCSYCDFLSYPVGENCIGGYGALISDYVDALCTEIKTYSYIAASHSIVTIYIGGGTPSVLDSAYMDKIMCTIRDTFDVAEDAEISIEVNPGTLTGKKAASYISLGINRMSIGLQSAKSDELKALGRIHNYDQFLAAFNTAREAGFRNINIDIMSAIPGQTMRSYLETLDKVLRMKPEHISSYSLIVEEGTPLAADSNLRSLIPDEELDRQMYDVTNRLLNTGGFHRYEISNYAKTGYECRHNIVYWTLEEYIGIGIGAASFFGGRRYTNDRSIATYIDTMKACSELLCEKTTPAHTAIIRNTVGAMRFVDEELCAMRLMEEYMFLGLRMIQGVSADSFERYFGHSIYDVYGPVIEKYKESGHLVDDHGLIYLTNKGLDVSNTILSDFILDNDIK